VRFKTRPLRVADLDRRRRFVASVGLVYDFGRDLVGWAFVQRLRDIALRLFQGGGVDEVA